MGRQHRYAAVLVICALLAARTFAAPAKTGAQILDSDMRVITTAGESVPAETMIPRGKPAVVEFWATWCIVCRTTMPHLRKLRVDFSEDQLTVLLLNIQEPERKRDSVLRIGRSLKVPVAFAPRTFTDVFGVNGVPWVLVFDREGRLVKSIVGYSTYGRLKREVAAVIGVDDLGSRPEARAKGITFYDVGLTCSSAPKLGCGSRAKRVLATLTADSRVAAAWVNEGGTRLAIRWKQSTASLTVKQLNAILAPHSLAVNPLHEKTYDEAAASFPPTQGWFDSGTIDELSRKESAIVADRIVRRLAKRVPLSKSQAAALTKAIITSCWKREGCQVDKDIASIGQEVALDSAAVDAFREVVALGYRPLENEQ
jgi:thiol-disulfide isomerase/thioredoxin